jgi:hypothetical protein
MRVQKSDSRTNNVWDKKAETTNLLLMCVDLSHYGIQRL